MESFTNRRDFLRIAAVGSLGTLLPALATAATPTTATPSPSSAARLVKPQFFGLHMVWPVRAPYVSNFPKVPVGAWRAMLPELHWFGLEPRKGEWKFDKLDIAMRLMESRGVDVLFALGETPTWASSDPGMKGGYIPGQFAPPRNIADWEDYVRTVAERYRGRIHHYEMWNEPTVREVDGDKARFTAAQLVELGQSAYRIIKEIDPQARLTTPAMVGGQKGVDRMAAYFAAGGDQCTDIVAFHYYGLPEQIAPYHSALLKVMADHGLGHLPVWNTEFGYLIADPTSPNTHPLIGGSFARVLPEQEAAAWLGRSLIIAASLGIERFFWFMWDGRNLGLVTYLERRINAAGVAYGTVARWLTGKRIGQVQRVGNVTFCPLFMQGGGIGRLVWTQDYKTVRWTVPQSWLTGTALAIESLDGRRQEIPSTDFVELSSSPVLIRALT